jgi:aquaporin Z
MQEELKWQLFLKLVDKLTSNQQKFIAEVIGTFVVVVFATGSVIVDSRLHGTLGISFIAFAPFVGIALCVYTSIQLLRLNS